MGNAKERELVVLFDRREMLRELSIGPENVMGPEKGQAPRELESPKQCWKIPS